MRNIRIITAVALLSAAVSAFADGGKLSYNDMRRYNYFFLEAVNQEAAAICRQPMTSWSMPDR